MTHVARQRTSITAASPPSVRWLSPARLTSSEGDNHGPCMSTSMTRAMQALTPTPPKLSRATMRVPRHPFQGVR